MREIHLQTPLSAKDIKKLSIGDTVFLSGKLFTARDQAHKKMIELKKKAKKIPFSPKEMVLYHAGPVARKEKNKWAIVSAGPTTSARMESFEKEFLSLFGVKMIIGKGGMGRETLKALKKAGAVYVHFTGGAGALAAKSIKKVENVYFLEELGIPEAVWILRIEKFGPLIVTMDAKGNSFYEKKEKVATKAQRHKEKQQK
ncbi:fumarate hydratase C-terminal domain-containing protein [candidate division WOR-3 bacterium]|nr:fumarate hydratase C-terminal domain-containing protein [candidate division WOR-3 bacterium]